MPSQPEAIVDDGPSLVEHEVGGGVVRLSTAATYDLGVHDPDDDGVTEVKLDQGLVWANVDGGPELLIRHGPTVLRTSGAQVLVDAGAGGDSLVVVVEGEVEVATDTVSAKRLSAGVAGQLSANGSLTEVADITEPELAADPWAKANRRLDASRTVASVGSWSHPESTERATTAEVSTGGPSWLDRGPARRRVEVGGLLGLALLLLVAAGAYVLTRDEPKRSVRTGAATAAGSRGTTARSAESATTTQPRSSTTKPIPKSKPKGVTPTKAQPGVRRVTGELVACMQSSGRVLVTGKTSDPARKARAYGVRVGLINLAGVRVAMADSLTPARPNGAPTLWTLPVTLPAAFARASARCQIIRVDAIN